MDKVIAEEAAWVIVGICKLWDWDVRDEEQWWCFEGGREGIKKKGRGGRPKKISSSESQRVLACGAEGRGSQPASNKPQLDDPGWLASVPGVADIVERYQWRASLEVTAHGNSGCLLSVGGRQTPAPGNGNTHSPCPAAESLARSHHSWAGLAAGVPGSWLVR